MMSLVSLSLVSLGVLSYVILSGGGSVRPRVGDASVSGDRPRTRPFGSRGGVDPQLILRRIRRKYRSQMADGCASPFGSSV